MHEQLTQLTIEEKLIKDRLQLLRQIAAMRQKIETLTQECDDNAKRLHTIYSLIGRNTGKKVGQIQPDILEAFDYFCNEDEPRPKQCQREGAATTRNLITDVLFKDRIMK